MATDSIVVSGVVPASPERVFAAWLDSKEHAAMTGGAATTATIEPAVGGEFQAWGDYITGTTLEIDAPRRIVQAWRTIEFPPDHDPSTIVVTFEPEGTDTLLTITHTAIPTGQGVVYEEGWKEHYFIPMIEYFGDHRDKPAMPDPTTAPPLPTEATEKSSAPKRAVKPRSSTAAPTAKGMKKARTSATGKAPAKGAVKVKKAVAKKAATTKGASMPKKAAARPKQVGAKGTAKGSKKKAASGTRARSS
jgi:uncharacterized protein YndB with AHSA1/START domain